MRSVNSRATGLLCRLEVGPEGARIAEIDVPWLVPLGGVVVDEHPNHPRQRTGNRHLSGAQQRDAERDRKSTRLNSSHQIISYAVFCLKKKKKNKITTYKIDKEQDTP